MQLAFAIELRQVPESTGQQVGQRDLVERACEGAGINQVKRVTCIGVVARAELHIEDTRERCNSLDNELVVLGLAIELIEQVDDK